MLSVSLSSCSNQQAQEGLTCHLQGEVKSTAGAPLKVNSCVGYEGYTLEEVKQSCQEDVQKWHDFATAKGKVKLTMNHPEQCPKAIARCNSIEALDTDMKVTKRRKLFHYNNEQSELESRRKGCEARHGKFTILN